MRFIEPIPVHSIIMDRTPLNRKTLALADFIRKEGADSLPPIHVQFIQFGPRRGNFRILDGRHRVTAFKLVGRIYIKARYGKNEAYEAAVAKGTHHLDQSIIKAFFGQTLASRGAKRKAQAKAF